VKGDKRTVGSFASIQTSSIICSLRGNLKRYILHPRFRLASGSNTQFSPRSSLRVAYNENIPSLSRKLSAVSTTWTPWCKYKYLDRDVSLREKIVVFAFRLLASSMKRYSKVSADPFQITTQIMKIFISIIATVSSSAPMGHLATI